MLLALALLSACQLYMAVAQRTGNKMERRTHISACHCQDAERLSTNACPSSAMEDFRWSSGFAFGLTTSSPAARVKAGKRAKAHGAVGAV